MKYTALFLALLGSAQACDKWSFKCGNDAYLCGVSQGEATEKSVTGLYIEGGSACSGLISQANKGGDVYEYKCPNNHAISHYTNWCTGEKCESTDCYIGNSNPPSAGGGGDPHFRTYDGTQYSFHGECDLVMARSAEKDLDIHIRTKSMGTWSLISNAALRVGNDILEFDNDGSHYINGSPLSLPYSLGGEHTVTGDVESFENLEGEKIERQVVTVDLGDKENIRMTVVKGMISVRVNAYFADTEGMLGVHHAAGMVSRNGETLADPNAMGAEWQVRDTEKHLFREVRFPQYPQTCIPPTVSGRRLRQNPQEVERAEQACAKVDDFSKHFCVEDVLLTGDVSAANGYLFGEAF